MESKTLPSMFELCLMHARADRGLRSVMSEQLAKQRLSLMEWLALNVAAQGSKQGASMSQMAITLDVSLPQVSALVTTLLKRGLVRQKVLAADRRGRQVLLTIRGKRTLQKLDSHVEAALRQWNQGIPQADLAGYHRTLARLADKS